MRIDDTEIAHARDTAPIYLALVLADAASYHAATLDSMPERYTPPVRIRLEMGRYVLGEDYARALKGREVLRRDVDAALAGHDAIVLPTLPIPAPPLGAASMEVGGRDEPVRNLMLQADAALQPDRPPGDLAAVRPYRRRPALRSATGRCTRADRRAAARRPRVRTTSGSLNW